MTAFTSELLEGWYYWVIYGLMLVGACDFYHNVCNFGFTGCSLSGGFLAVSSWDDFSGIGPVGSVLGGG